MELRSGRSLRRSSPPPHESSSRRKDLISALPDEMLLLVLARLRCVRTAVQTGILSRRWRGVWMGLTDLTFSGLEPSLIQELLRRFAASPQLVSLLDIDISSGHTTADANSLLRAAVQLSPRQLLMTFQESCVGDSGHIDLPCFDGTSLIQIDSWHFDLRPLPTGEFTALESLYLTGKIIDLGSLLNRCPRLRVHSVSYPERHLLPIALPPGLEIPTLEKLSLSGEILDLDSVMNSCQRLRVLRVTQLDTSLATTPPPSGEFAMVEKLSLSGNITDLGTFLNQCPRLRVLAVTFCGMGLRSIKVALTVLEKARPCGLMVSVLGIEIPWRDDISPRRFAYLLRIAAKISPRELAITDKFTGCSSALGTRIKVNMPSTEFSTLERLSLPRLCRVVDIGTLVTRCPRLRVLNIDVDSGNIMVHSASLQKLYLNTNYYTECHNINIVTPVLEQLHIEVHARGDIDVSISAPMLENVSWQRSYTGSALLFGFWRLWSLRVQTIERTYDIKKEDMPLFMQQLLPFHGLRLHLAADNRSDAELNFTREVEKLPLTNFAVLEINFEPPCHVYGALILRILGKRQIRAATKSLRPSLVVKYFRNESILKLQYFSVEAYNTSVLINQSIFEVL